MQQIKLICVDMDGTLLSPDHRTISQENRDAIFLAQSRGVLVVPSTGRISSRLSAQVAELPFLQWAIVSNGGEVVNLQTGQVLGGRYLSAQTTLQLLQYFEAEGLAAMVYQGEKMLITPKDLAALQKVPDEAAHLAQLIEMQTTVLDMAEHFAHFPDRIQKINLPYVTPEARRQKLLSQYAKLGLAQVTCSMPHNIECNALGATKAEGLRILCRHLNLSPCQTAAIGDGANDLALFDAVGLSIAMENAAPAVQAAADWVTCSNQHSGVAHAILRILDQNFR